MPRLLKSSPNKAGGKRGRNPQKAWGPGSHPAKLGGTVGWREGLLLTRALPPKDRQGSSGRPEAQARTQLREAVQGP